MKLRSLFAMVFAAIIITPAVVTAKPSIWKFDPPPPGRYNIEDLWSVTLNNPDPQTYEVWLEGAITEARQGQVFWAKTRQFPLPPGTMVVRYADIQRFGIERQTHAPGYEQFAARTGGLPEGNYTFVVKLMPDHDEKSYGFEVAPTGPPRLISPRDGDTVTARYPQFVWTPPSPMPKGPVTYELKLWQVLPGQTAEEAAAANRPWFKQGNIRATSLTYPTSARYWPDSGHFCWQVASRDPAGATTVSEVWSIAYARSGQQPDSATAFPSVLELDIAEASFGQGPGKTAGSGGWLIPVQDVSLILNDPPAKEVPIGVLLVPPELAVVYFRVERDTAYFRAVSPAGQTLTNGRGKWTPKGSGGEVVDTIRFDDLRLPGLCYAIVIRREHQDTPGHKRYCLNKLVIRFESGPPWWN